MYSPAHYQLRHRLHKVHVITSLLLFSTHLFLVLSIFPFSPVFLSENSTTASILRLHVLLTRLLLEALIAVDLVVEVAVVRHQEVRVSGVAEGERVGAVAVEGAAVGVSGDGGLERGLS